MAGPKILPHLDVPVADLVVVLEFLEAGDIDRASDRVTQIMNQCPELKGTTHEGNHHCAAD